MRARPASILVLVLAATASADPKPTAVDIKPFRDQLIVLQDAQGGTYVLQPGMDGRVWYGTGKTLYEQVVGTRTANGETGAWSVGVWAPRVPDTAPGILQRRDDGTFERFCGGDEAYHFVLAQRTGATAKKILDGSTFMTTAMIRKPRMLGRDDSGVYYYVDEIRRDYGGKGYRVFVGKKGAMKELPLVDIATDSAGDVFSTKTGELRLVRVINNPQDHATWVKGDKRSELTVLDVDVNSPLIYKDLGVYGFVGTLCDDL